MFNYSTCDDRNVQTGEPDTNAGDQFQTIDSTISNPSVLDDNSGYIGKFDDIESKKSDSVDYIITFETFRLVMTNKIQQIASPITACALAI